MTEPTNEALVQLVLDTRAALGACAAQVDALRAWAGDTGEPTP